MKADISFPTYPHSPTVSRTGVTLRTSGTGITYNHLLLFQYFSRQSPVSVAGKVHIKNFSQKRAWTRLAALEGGGIPVDAARPLVA